jgi:hypothetical protein
VDNGDCITVYLSDQLLFFKTLISEWDPLLSASDVQTVVSSDSCSRGGFS